MRKIGERLSALERKRPVGSQKWHRIHRYEGETQEQVVAAYEAEHGPIGSDNVILRVIVGKPDCRPAA